MNRRDHTKTAVDALGRTGLARDDNLPEPGDTGRTFVVIRTTPPRAATGMPCLGDLAYDDGHPRSKDGRSKKGKK